MGFGLLPGIGSGTGQASRLVVEDETKTTQCFWSSKFQGMFTSSQRR